MNPWVAQWILDPVEKMTWDRISPSPIQRTHSASPRSSRRLTIFVFVIYTTTRTDVRTVFSFYWCVISVCDLEFISLTVFRRFSKLAAQKSPKTTPIRQVTAVQRPTNDGHSGSPQNIQRRILGGQDHSGSKGRGLFRGHPGLKKYEGHSGSSITDNAT